MVKLVFMKVWIKFDAFLMYCCFMILKEDFFMSITY